LACAPEKTPTVDPDDGNRAPVKPEITSYQITVHQGGQRLVLRGGIDQEGKRVALVAPSNQRRVNDVDSAIAEFAVSSSVAEVQVNGVAQTSGVTPNDFRRDFAYSLISKEGDTTVYALETFASPQTTGLPVFYVDTRGVAITNKTDYVHCTLAVADPADPNNDKKIALTGDGIRLRGNTTMNYDKKPYRLKFDKKEDFFSLGKAKSWVLLANYLDPTLLANSVAFELGRRFAAQRQGDKPFVNSVNHVELFINDEYAGSYLFTEQVQVNEYRVNIDEDAGYLLELDSYYDEDNKFKVNMLPGGAENTRLPVNIQSPEDDAGANALPAIRADVELLVSRLTNNLQLDRPDDRYRDLINMTSTVDFLIINEIVGNQELQHPKSTYMYKDAGDPWSFGPLWDFDWAFGYAESGFTYFVDNKTTRFLFNASTNFRGDPRAGNIFFALFFRDPRFREAYKARWNEMKPHFSTIADFIGEMGNKLARSAAQNKIRWNMHYSSINYASEIAKMKAYMTTRINYLDGAINSSAW
jgi:hypothetical protein